jgi:hypothetical protein
MASTESRIKVWIVSDFLRRSTEAGRKPSDVRLRQASHAIRYSSDDSAEALYDLGGRQSVVTRYPGERGLEYGAAICADVAAQLVTPAAHRPVRP